jgi:hypothetical protein
MKTALVLVTLILVMLACGCTGSAPAQQPGAAATDMAGSVPAAVPATPDLVGTWTGTMTGYEEGMGFTDYNNTPITLVVTEQKGRIFSCYLTFGHNSTEKLACAGVIGRDGRTFSMVEDINGFTAGELTGTGTMELTHIDDSQPYGAALDTLKRG